MQYAVDLILLAVLAITVVVSAKKGFFYSLFELAGYLISVLFAKLFSAQVAPNVFETLLKEPLSKKVSSILGSGATVNYKDAATEIFNKIPSWAEGLIKSMGIDQESVVNSLSSADLSGENVLETVMNKVVTPIATSVLQLIIFAVCALVFMFVLKVVVKLLNKIIKKLPVFKGLNSVLGAVLGAFKGLVVVFIIAVIISALSGLSGSEEFVNSVSNSFFISSIKGILTQISGYTA